MKKEIGNDEETLILSHNISWVEIKNEIFVINEQNGNMLMFREIERDIWKLLIKGLTVSSIVEYMQEHFCVESGKTMKVITKFSEKGLISKGE